MTNELTMLTGVILDEEMECDLHDLCRLCNISAETVREMIDEGLINPPGREPGQWRFTTVEIRRIQVTQRLQHDLRVNLPGCALVLELLEEIQRLRQQRSRG